MGSDGPGLSLGGVSAWKMTGIGPMLDLHAPGTWWVFSVDNPKETRQRRGSSQGSVDGTP